MTRMVKKSIDAATVVAVAALLAACAAPEQGDSRLAGPTDGDLLRLASPPAPPRLTAGDPAEVADAAFAAARLDPERLAAQNGFRRVEVSAIPYLRASPEGARFLSVEGPRALARGEPAAFCPISGVSPPGAPDEGSAAAAALDECLAARTDPDCACRLMALGDFLLAPRRDFVFAPVVSAYLIEPAEAPRTLVAEALPPENGRERALLRDGLGVVAGIEFRGRDARLILDGETYEGRREPFGYRRGR
ncbi:MAG: hypothetical protein AAF322_13920, partial [Pseudomonadota bacterium]